MMVNTDKVMSLYMSHLMRKGVVLTLEHNVSIDPHDDGYGYVDVRDSAGVLQYAAEFTEEENDRVFFEDIVLNYYMV